MVHNTCHANFESLSETWKEQDLSTAAARRAIGNFVHPRVPKPVTISGKIGDKEGEV